MSPNREIEPYCFDRFHYEGLTRKLTMTDLEKIHVDGLDINAQVTLDLMQSLPGYEAALHFYRSAREEHYQARLIVLQVPFVFTTHVACEVLPRNTGGSWYLDQRHRGAYYSHEPEPTLFQLPWNFSYQVCPNFDVDVFNHVFA